MPAVRSHAAADGRVWFGPSSGGLFWIRDGQVHQVKEAGLPDDVVYSIHGGGREVWVGRQRGGVTVLRVGDGGITAERYTQRDGLAQDSVFAIHRTRDGSVWAGTLSGGASLLTQGRLVTYDTRSGLPSNTVASLLEAGDGTMWFGTPNGLTARSPRGWRTYTTADGLPSNDVNTLFEDRAGHALGGHGQGRRPGPGRQRHVRRGRRAGAARLDPRLRGRCPGLALDPRDRRDPARQSPGPGGRRLAAGRRAPLRHRRWAAGRGVGQAAPHRDPGRTGTDLVRAHARAVDGRSGARRWPRPAGGDPRRAVDRRRRIGGHARPDPACRPAAAGSRSATPA